MTDRELLELAAKAAHLDRYEYLEKSNSCYSESWSYMTIPGSYTPWNPLSDDGDALRLAIKLEMEVSFGLRGAVIEQSHGRKVQEIDENEPYAANRRAIVRAAAEIGRNMK